MRLIRPEALRRAAGALLLCAASAAATPRLTLDDCVQPPSPAAVPTKAGSAGVGSSVDIGNLTLIELDGDYARGLDAPRRAIAQRFYESHADRYDFIAAFTTFEFETGSALAFYNPVRNDVQGIGMAAFDHGAAFGSAARLQGYVDMAAVSRYAEAPGDLRITGAHSTLAHELMHRWGSRVSYRTDAGTPSTALIGQDGSHWSYFLDTDASIMYGADWNPRADGRFQSVAVRRRFSPLDLYVAGFASSSEVPPMRLIVGGDGNATDLPRLGAISGGSAETVRIEQIVAAVGARVPDAAHAQKDFRVALILIRRPGEAVAPTTLAALENARVRLQEYFNQITDGRASLRIYNEPALAAAQLPTVLSGSGTAATPPGVAAAIAWIKQRQQPDGHWQDRAATAVRDTAATIQLLQLADPDWPGLASARAWLAARTTANHDQRSWQLVADAQIPSAPLTDAQSTAGGWGLAEGLQDSTLDTALVADALAQRGADASALQRALTQLGTRQNADGSFALAAQGRGRLLPTLRAARVFARSTQPAHLTIRDAATQWLASRQRADGSFADTGTAFAEPTLADTIELYGLVGRLPLTSVAANNARDYVVGAQQTAGDWQGSIYLTATAALARLYDDKANLAAAGVADVMPADAIDGDVLTLTVRVVNAGARAAAASVARWYAGDPEAGGVAIGAEQSVPALAAGATAAVQQRWDSSGRSGPQTLWLVLDAHDDIAEQDETDNRIAIPLTIAGAPAQADIALDARLFTLTPGAVASLPATIQLSGSVRNLGSTPVTSARITLYEDGEPRRTLATTTLDLPARGSAPLQLAFSATTAATLRLRLVADPEDTVAEARENNNDAPLLLPFGPSLDLDVRDADLALIDAAPPAQGRDVGFRIQLRNRGTLTANDAALRISVQQAASEETLFDGPITLEPGQTIERRHYWRAREPGAAVLRVQLDAAGELAELDESNNSAQRPFTIAAASGSDLVAVPGSLQFTPQPALQGAPLQASVRVRNGGADASGSFVVALFANDPRSGGTRLAQTTISSLASQAETTATLTLADLALAGDTPLFVAIDADQQVAETDEGNNLALQTVNVLPFADIAVASAAMQLTPSAPAVGAPQQVSAVVRNLGAQPAQNVVVRLLEGGAESGIAIGADQVIAELAAGAETTLSWSWTFGLQPGARQLTLLADPARALRENQTLNNLAILPLALQDAGFYASERHFSPNGDGVRDSTALYFSRRGAGRIDVLIRNGAGRVVRRFDDVAGVDAASGHRVWDGRDDRGRLVADGVYLAELWTSGSTTAEFALTVDTDRSSLIAAIGTPLLHDVKLPRGDEWFQPPATPVTRDLLFARRYAPNATGFEATIVRGNLLSGSTAAVMSSRWFVEHVGRTPFNDVDGALGAVDAAQFSPDGRWIAYYIRNGERMQLLVAAADQSDQILVLDGDAFPIADQYQAQPPRFLDPTHLLAGTWPRLSVYDLQTRTRTDFREIPGGRDLLAFEHGAYVWTQGLHDPPAFYVPRDPARPVVAFSGDIVAASIAGDGTRALLTRYATSDESVHLFRTDRGDEVLLQRRTPQTYSVPGIAETAQRRSLQAQWIAADDSALVIDAAQRRLTVHSRDGAVQRAVQLPDVDAAVDLGPDPDRFHGEHQRVPVLFNGDDCNGNRVNCIGAAWTSGDRRDQWFDPTTRRVTLLLASHHLGRVSCEAGYCIGTAPATLEAFSVDIDDGSQQRVAAMQRPEQIPAELQPRLRLGDGATLETDGRYRISGALPSTRAWDYGDAETVRSYRLGGNDDSVVFERPLATHAASALVNLAAQIWAEPTDRAIALSGVAADLNFAGYQLDWASPTAPTQWHAISPRSYDPVVAGEFLTWIPPQPGRYLIRLSVFDKAGNVATRQTSTLSQFGSPVSDFSVDERYFSPNGDGIKDVVTARFTLAATAQLDVRVIDASGRVVRSDPRVYDAGVTTFVWDGRDGNGALQPDGRYVIDVGGLRYSVSLDTLAPSLHGSLLQPNVSADASGLAYAGTLAASAIGADAHLARSALELRAQGDSEWREFDLGDTIVASLYGYGPLAGKTVREVAYDRAGNRATRELGSVVEQLLLVDCRTGLIPPCDLLNRVDAIGSTAAPVHAADFPQEITVVEDPAHFPVLVMDAGARFVSIEVEVADTARPGEWRLLASLPTALAPDPLAQQHRLLEARLPLQDLPLGADRRLRLVGLRSDGSRLHGDQIRVLINGLGPSMTLCAGADPATLPPEYRTLVGRDADAVQQIVPVLVPNASAGAKLQLGTRFDIARGRYEVLAATAHHPNAAVFRIPRERIEQNNALAGRPALVLSDQRTLLGNTAEFDLCDPIDGTGGGGPPPTGSVGAGPVAGATCAATPTHRIRIGAAQQMPQALIQNLDRLVITINHIAGSPEVLLDLASPPNHALPGELFNWRYLHEFATGERAEGGYGTAAELRAFGSPAAIPFDSGSLHIDRDAPQVELNWPSTGTRVCANRNGSGLPRIDFAGQTYSDSPTGAQIELVPHGTNDQERCLTRGLVDGACPTPTIDPLSDPRGAIRLSAEGEAVADINGLIDAQLRVMNWSGAVVCANAQFYLDSKVELGLAGEPEPLIGTALLDSGAGEPARTPLLGVSTVGATRFRTAAIEFIAREPLSVRATLHRATRDGAMHTVGAEVGTLLHDPSVEGRFQVSWNGRIDGAAATDGLYAIRLVAEDDCGWVDTRHYVIDADSTPPTLAITDPAAGAVPALAVVAISGHVDDAHFASVATAQPYWQLLVEHSGSSQLVAEDDVAVPQPAVLGRWSRGTAQDAGRYLLRAADDFGNTAEIGQPFGAPAPLALIGGAQALPELFSPNGDGRLDQTQLRLQLLANAQVDVRIRDAGGAIVAELAQNTPMAAGARSVSWSGSGMPDGNYVVEIVARSPGEPVATESATLALTLDTVAPGIVDVTPAGEQANAGESAGFRVVEPRLDRFDARLTAVDGGAVIAQLGGTGTGVQQLAALHGLAERAYRLNVRAQDRADNQTDYLHAFTLDATAPDAVLSAPVRDSVLPRIGDAVAIIGSARDTNLADYRVELRRAGDSSGTVLATGTSDVVAATLAQWNVTQADGDYALYLRVRDRAGNSAEATQPLAIDGTPPVVAITAPAAGDAFAGRLLLRGSVLDAHLRDYRVAIATPSQALAGNWTALYRGEAAVSDGVLADVELALPDDDYGLRVLATDATGASTTATLELRLDRSAPPAPLQLRVRLSGTAAVLDWSPSDANDLAGYAVWRNGARITPALASAPHYTDAALTDGRWHYEVSAIDRAGNESARSNRVEVALDRTPPQVSLQAPLAAARVHGVVAVIGTAYSADDFDGYTLTARRSDGSDAPVTLAQGSLPQRNQVLAQWNSLTYTEETDVTLRLAARDASGNEAVSEIAVVVDNLAPAAPQGLVATLAGTDGAIAWNANTEPDLLGYLLYRNGRLVNGPSQLPADLRGFALVTTSYTDAALADGTHRYVVFAIDRAGNISAPSGGADIGPIDNGPPHLVIDTPDDDTAFETTIDVRATSPDGDIASVQFAYRAAGASNWTALGAALGETPYALRWTPGALAHGDYEIRALARDSGGLDDPQPPQVRVRYADLTAPVGPSALQAVADGDSVQLSWTASSDAGVVAYRVERRDGSDWQRVGDDAAGTTRSDTGLSDGRQDYRVRALDAAGNLSTASEDHAIVFALHLDTPFTPTTQATTSLQGRSDMPGTLSLRINADAEQPVGATGADGGFTLAGVALQTGDNALAVRATTSAGDRSRRATRRVLRAAVPAAPTGVQVSASGYAVSLHWNANAEADVIGYRVEHNGGYVHPDATLSGVTAVSTTCCDAERAADGDSGTHWDIATWLEPLALAADTDPVLELDLGNAQIVSALELDWGDTATASGNLDVYADAGHDAWVRIAQQRAAPAASMTLTLPAAYRSSKLRLVVRSPVAAGGSTHLTLAEVRVRAWHLVDATTLEQTVLDGQHRYRVAAVSASALQSAWSDAVGIGIGDITPPDPVVLDGTLAANTATLTWSASVAPDVARYALSRNGSPLAEIPANAQRLHVDPNLALGEYVYDVVAIDAFGNASAASNRLTVQVAGSGPGVPQALAVVAPPQGALLQLSWNAGDGSAAVRYLVRRALSVDGPFAEIASVTVTTHTDTLLVNATRYFYTVEAVDAAGNRSGASPAASGVPRDALAPAAPLLTYPVAGGGRVAIDGDRSLVCGRAEAGSRVEIRRDTAVIATTNAAAQVQQSDHPTAGTYTYSALSLAADGWHLADTGNGLRIVDLRDERVETAAVAARLAQWSAQALTLYYIEGEQLYAKHPGRAAQPLPLSTVAIHGYAVATDEQRVLLYGRRGTDTSDTLWWIARDGGDARRIAGIGDYPIDPNVAPRLRADARYAALATTDARLVVVDLDAARVLDAVAADAHIRPDWSPDGGLAFTRSDAGTPTLWHYDVLARRADPRFALPPATQAFAWSPDGSELALLANDRIEGRSALDGSLRFDAQAAINGTNVGTFDWAASARIVVIGANAAGLSRLYSLQPPGAFCAGPLALRAGANRIDAVAIDAAGNRSAASLTQTLDVDAAALPDLALSADDVFFVPATPLPGQSASALVTVRNRGAAGAATVVLAASLRAPDGSTRNLPSGAAFALAAGASRSLSFDLGVLAQTGHYRLQLVVDPDSQVTERDETNNRVDAALAVSDGGTPLLDLALAGNVLAPGASLGGDVRVTSPGRTFSGRLRLQILANDGTLVTDLGETSITEIAPGQTWTKPLAWNSTGVLAGDYRVRARLLRTDGSTVTERDAAFAVEAVRRIDLAVAALPAQQPVGATVVIDSGLHFVSGNALLPGATLRTSVHAGSGAEVWAATQALGTLQPGYALRRSDSWDTHAAAPGVYTLRLRLAAPGFETATENSVALVPSGTNASLTGALTLSPDGRVVAGRGDTLVYRVDNPGAALGGVQLRLRVLRTPALTSAFEREETVDLAAGASLAQSLALNVPPLALGSHVAVLDARLPGDPAGSWRYLARLGFAALDEQPPSIAIASPLPGSLQPALVDVRALIADAHADIAGAQLRIDNGGWQPLALGGSGSWSLTLAGLADGAHTLSVRARDRWDNESVSASVAFAVDATAPLIALGGIAEGALTNQIVLPTVTISDVHLDSAQTRVELNGAPYVSGTPVTADGSYTLSVYARDRAGNETLASLHFTLDRTPPALTITSPADASVVAVSAVDVIVDSEAGARVALQAGAFGAERLADAVGRAVFDAVPLAEGDNPIDVTATDRAGNTGPARRVTVRYEAVVAQALVGTVQPAQSELAHGAPLSVALQLRNPGSVALPEQRVRLRVVGADGGVLAQRDYARAFGASESFADTLQFDTATWPLALLSLRLDVERETQWIALDTQDVRLVDRAPPLLQALAPAAGAIVAAPLRLRAQASDALSAPVTVEASVDDGTWTALSASGGDVFESAALKLADGAHAVRLRARDAAGNEASLAAVAFTVDSLAPQITISGVADGDLVNQAVTPLIEISDTHPATTLLRLNGQPYVSGTVIGSSGDYALHVQAQDAAGNRATRDLAFTLDREAPVVLVDAPVPGSTVALAAQEIAGRTEPHADVAVEAPGLITLVRADANGAFRTAAATLLTGGNTVRLRATDRAGNVGDEAVVTVTYAPATGEALAAQFLDALLSVRRGEPLMPRYVLRNPGTLALDATPVRVQLRASGNSGVIAQDAYTMSLGAGGEITRSSTFATDTLAVGGYRIDIAASLRDAQGQSHWTDLGEIEVQIRQGCPEGRPLDRLFGDGFGDGGDDAIFCHGFDTAPKRGTGWLPQLLFAPARLGGPRPPTAPMAAGVSR